MTNKNISIDNIVSTRIQTDVLIIGSGIAGVFAAINARKEGVDVALVDKGTVGKSGKSPFFMAIPSSKIVVTLKNRP